jgi:hypothetical protein
MIPFAPAVAGAADSALAEPSAPDLITLRGTLTSRGRGVELVRHAGERYVLTRLGDALLFFCDGRRYVVSRSSGKLVELDLSRLERQAIQLRAALGGVESATAPGSFSIDGFLCRRRTLAGGGRHLQLTGELYIAELPGLSRTLLPEENAFEERLRGFGLGLAPDEVVVRSWFRLGAQRLIQDQSYRLERVERGGADASLQEILGYSLVQRPLPGPTGAGQVRVPTPEEAGGPG